MSFNWKSYVTFIRSLIFTFWEYHYCIYLFFNFQKIFKPNYSFNYSFDGEIFISLFADSLYLIKRECWYEIKYFTNENREIFYFTNLNICLFLCIHVRGLHGPDFSGLCSPRSEVKIKISARAQPEAKY